MNIKKNQVRLKKMKNTGTEIKDAMDKLNNRLVEQKTLLQKHPERAQAYKDERYQYDIQSIVKRMRHQ